MKINGTTHNIEFHVIDGKCKPVIGQPCATKIGVLKIQVNNIETANCDYILNEYSDRFEGLGKLKDFKLKLHINKDVKPVAQPPRRMPFQVRKQVQSKLDELLKQDVIERVEGPTPCISPLVVIPKQNKDIRICVDMRIANSAVERERFPLPNIEETLEEMNGAKIYSKMDLFQGFHQIELADESREITTFVTNDAIYRYKRLMFGISCAPEIYQRIIQQVIHDIPGCRNISDDIIVFGKNQHEHDKALRAVLQRLREKNLTLNKDKCEFNQSSISYTGHTLTAEGLMPQDSKIRAVQETEAPKCAKDVKSFLGLVSYCSKFIPNFATISEPLRRLTRKNQEFVWNDEQQNTFNTLKKMLTSAKVMSYYNPEAETRLTVDASPVGLGAILEQIQEDGEFHPVAYASRTLNATERRYSQIEREALAIYWGILRFHVYLYGTDFKVITDHKPLETIFTAKHDPPARIQRWILKLQCYTFKVLYQPGSQNAADVLSRSPLCVDESEKDLTLKTEQYINYLAEADVPKAMTLTEIKTESAKDKVITEVIDAIKQNRWPNKDYLTPYYKVRNELTVHNDIILRGTKLVIPSVLQARVLAIAHESHLGIVKTKQLLREKVWWAGIHRDVENLISTCRTCQMFANAPKPPPLLPSDLPTQRWERVGMDLLGPYPGGEYLFVVIDYYSRYPEVEIIKSTTSTTIIQRLMRIFASHGLPLEVTTDNGPQFVSEEFKKFLYDNGIKHKRTTPYWPKGNGLTENFNKSLSKFMKTSKITQRNWRTEIYKFLLSYRTTPHCTTGVAPAECLYSRKLRNKLPHFVQKENDKALRDRDRKNKLRMKRNADKKAGNFIKYRIGQKVMILRRETSKTVPKWEEGYVVLSQKGTQVRVTKNGQTYFRNVSHTKPYRIMNEE